jgi:hypothetical protein
MPRYVSPQGAFVSLLFGIFFCYLMVVGAKSGQLPVRGRWIDRATEPKSFWLFLAFYTFLCAGLLGFSLYAVCGHLD